MWQWKPNTPPDELWHSAKGKTWSKHKYIRKEGNRYIYPEDVNKKSNRTKAKSLNELEDDYQTAKRNHENALMERDSYNEAADVARVKRNNYERQINGKNAYMDYSNKLGSRQAGKEMRLQEGLAAGAQRRADKLYDERLEKERAVGERKLRMKNYASKGGPKTHGGSGGNIDEAVNKAAKKKKRKENLKKHAKGIFYASGPVGKAAQSAENTYSLSKKAYDEEKKKKKNNTSLARR